jgi:putative transposon-encoded protein
MVLGRFIIPPEHFLGKSIQKRAVAGLFQKKVPKNGASAKIINTKKIIGKRGRKQMIIWGKTKSIRFLM